MKKIGFLLLALIFSIFSMTSCDVEPVGSGVENLLDNPPPGGGGGGGQLDTGGTSTGDYWPMAINNEWNFISESGDPYQSLELSSTSTVNGAVYYNVSNGIPFYSLDHLDDLGVSVEVTMRVRKHNAGYLARVEDLTTEAFDITTTITGSEMVLFRDDLNVGQTWNGSYTQNMIVTSDLFPEPIPPVQIHVSYTGTVLERDSTVTVQGVTYTDVIKTKLVVHYTGGEQLNDVPSVENYYWFAKEIGPVKAMTTEDGESVIIELDSYTLN